MCAKKWFYKFLSSRLCRIQSPTFSHSSSKRVKEVIDGRMADPRGTFDLDDGLADYPLPALGQSLDLYLQSTKPLLSADDFKKTEEVVRDFQNNEGPILHQVLTERSKEKRNWVR